jgi:hypothetical protein
MVYLEASFTGGQLASKLIEDPEELGLALIEFSDHDVDAILDDLEEFTNGQVADWLIGLGEKLKKLHEST